MRAQLAQHIALLSVAAAAAAVASLAWWSAFVVLPALAAARLLDR